MSFKEKEPCVIRIWDREGEPAQGNGNAWTVVIICLENFQGTFSALHFSPATCGFFLSCSLPGTNEIK